MLIERRLNLGAKKTTKEKGLLMQTGHPTMLKFITLCLRLRCFQFFEVYLLRTIQSYGLYDHT